MDITASVKHNFIALQIFAAEQYGFWVICPGLVVCLFLKLKKQKQTLYLKRVLSMLPKLLF